MYNEVLEDLIVVKRSGQRVSFNASKVAIAIKKAFDSVDSSDEKKIFKIFEKVLCYINENYRERKTINVEDIQDIIENILYNEKCYTVYNSFKEYRQKRALSRKVFAEKQQHKFVKAIERIGETSLAKCGNKCADDLIYDFGKIISCEYTMSYILDSKSTRASEEGNIYIHDLDYFVLGMFPNIHLSINQKLEKDYDIDLLINKIINIEREVYGEIAINDLDKVLETFLLKKFKKRFIDVLRKYLKIFGFLDFINMKKIEENINNESSIDIDIGRYNDFLVNEQLEKIFGFALDESKEYVSLIANKVLEKIMISLEHRAERGTTYTISYGSNNTVLGNLISEKLNCLFSKNTYAKINLVFKIKEIDINVINNLSTILEKNNVVALNLDTRSNINYFFNGIRIYENTNSLEQISEGRMVVSSTSINLARLGLKYKNKPIEQFYEELGNVCELVKNELLLSFETIGSKSKDYYRELFTGNVYDDEKLEIGQRIRKVIKNDLLNIGIIGLKECAVCLESDESKRIKIIEDIIDFLNKKIEGYTKDTKLNFGLYEPIDRKSRARLLAIDKAIYGVVTDVTDKKYYDLLDVGILGSWEKLSAIQKNLSSGKCIDVHITGKISIKKIADTLELFKNSGIDFVRLVVGKHED